jgi:tRNA (guanine26-N2/guanine27-N2)-dimethyltransferase
MMEEEGIAFDAPEGVFYNPRMRLCRSFASLAVGALPEKELVACDAFCASGIRGIRYAKENGNIDRTMFVDIGEREFLAAKANAKRAKMKYEALHGNISRLVFDIRADFLEIDPFGSPAPYLYDSFRAFNPLKRAYLSVTATDVAVLCGGKTKACLKNYHSYPMNNEFTHETGMRIMIKKIAETAAEFNMGIEPLVSLSKEHYLKTIVKVTRGADLAHESLMKLGYVNFCPACGWRGSSQFPERRCPSCAPRTKKPKQEVRFAGPLWLGELHDAKTLSRMGALNRRRAYTDKEELGKIITRMGGEVGMPPFYYDVHQMCRLLGRGSVPKMDAVLEKLQKKGDRAVRTHFSETAIKTDATLKAVKSVIS